MYEELGDLVDRDVIEKALDEYLSQRYAFTPAPPGPKRHLALLYIRRGMVTRRVLLPAAGVAALVWVGFAGVEMLQRQAVEREAEAARTRVERLATFETEVDRLHAATLAVAIEDLALARVAALRRSAEAQLAAGNAEGLGETVRRSEALYNLVATEAEIVVTGGVWRQSNDDPDIRNYYLLVRALDGDGRQVSFAIRHEEEGITAWVREWGERVPKEIYDRVGADKQDNGIIDDEHFGLKRLGFVTAERRYENLGQITEW